jgi:outer membrane translocation and assembly module TamA
LLGLNNYSNNIGQAGADLNLYTNFISKKHVVLATSFGVSHNIGNFEFEQAQYLGFKQNLRGFRIERFAGRTRAYNNSEIRIKIADINAYLFPAAFGILGFSDVGRVWSDNETSSTWHNGYGGGIWIAPLNKIVVTGSMTYSKEEKNLGLITFGFQF